MHGCSGVEQKAHVAISEAELKLSSRTAEVTVVAARPRRRSCKIKLSKARAVLTS